MTQYSSLQSRESPEFSTASEAIQVASTIVKARPVTFSFWLLGLAVALFGTGFSVTQAQMNDYEDAMTQATKTTNRDILEARNAFNRADLEYRNAKGWLPFSCDANCMRMYNKQQLAQTRLDDVMSRRDSLIKEARQTVGIWSIVGVSEIRQKFWDAWEQGKETAKRWTMMDAIFMAISPGERDRQLIHVVLQIMFQYLANLTIGLISAMIFFLITVYSMVRSYGESFFSGVAFFGLVFCAVCSVVFSYLVLIGGTMTVGARYVIKKEEQRQRLQGGRRNREMRDHAD